MYYDIVNSGERIKELRAARRMTRQQLAEQIAEKLAPVTCAHAATEEGHREACSCHLCPYCGGRRVQRSLPLSPVPTLRRKKGTEKLAPVICAHAAAEEGYKRAFAA